MTTTTSNQQIVIQQLVDAANLPSAQVAEVGSFENKLAQRYTNEADRTARNPAPNENEISQLAAEDRVEIFNGSIWYSLYNRIFYGSYRVTSFSTAVSSTTLANVTGASVTLPTAGTFAWKSTVFASGVTASDVKFAYTWPAGASAIWGIHGLDTAGTGFVGSAGTSSAGSIAVGLLGTTSPTMYTIEGEITMGGTGGALQLQAAQNTSDPTAVLLRLVRLYLWRIS